MTATQVPLSGAAALLIGLAALAVVAVNVLWRFFQHGMVMAHEGGHAAVSALMARKVRGIKLNGNATGETKAASGIWPGTVLFFTSGYLGPSLFGLAAAKMIETDHIVQVLWIALFLLALLLLAVTTGFGAFAVIVAGGLLFLVIRYTPMSVQIVAAYAIAWLLLLSGVRGILEDGFTADDAGKLWDKTFVPGFIWFFFWLGCTLTAVAAGAKWLIFRT